MYLPLVGSAESVPCSALLPAGDHILQVLHRRRPVGRRLLAQRFHKPVLLGCVVPALLRARHASRGCRSCALLDGELEAPEQEAQAAALASQHKRGRMLQ